MILREPLAASEIDQPIINSHTHLDFENAASPEFFSLLDISWRQGQAMPPIAAQSVSTAWLSQSACPALFPTHNCVGAIVRMGNGDGLTIAGVLPHIRWDLLPIKDALGALYLSLNNPPAATYTGGFRTARLLLHMPISSETARNRTLTTLKLAVPDAVFEPLKSYTLAIKERRRNFENFTLFLGLFAVLAAAASLFGAYTVHASIQNARLSEYRIHRILGARNRDFWKSLTQDLMRMLLPGFIFGGGMAALLLQEAERSFSGGYGFLVALFTGINLNNGNHSCERRIENFSTLIFVDYSLEREVSMMELLRNRFSQRLKKVNSFIHLLRESLRYAPRSALPIVLGVILVDNVLSAAAPLALRGAVNELAGHAAGPALGYIALYAVLEAASAGGTAAFVNRSYARLEYGVRYTLSMQAYRHLLHLPQATYLTHKVGQLTTIVGKGLNGALGVQRALIRGLLPAVLQVLLVVGILFGVVPPTVAIIFVIFVIFYGLIFRRNLLRIMARQREGNGADIAASALATDAVINHETIKLFGAENEISARIGAAYSSSRDRWISFAGATAKSSGQTALVVLICIGAALYLTAEQTLRGTMTVGGFVMVSAYFLRLIEPLRFLFGGVGQLAGGLVDFQQLLDLLSKPVEQAIGNPVLPGNGPLTLEFDRVTFAYPGRENVLEEISFKVPAGQTVALVGASGAGKSTIARLIFRLYTPDRGAIYIDGVAIDHFAPSAIRSAIAIVPQDTVLFHDSIAANVGLPRPEASAVEIEEAVRLAGLAPLIERLPDGLQTIVGERGLKLSGGEKQRVAIARAILKRPRLFVLDEATSALDSATEKTILENLARTTAGVTTIAIAHRLSTIRSADEILVIDRGRVVEQGTHAELLLRGGLYAQMYSEPRI